MTNDLIKRDKTTTPGGVNYWTSEDERYLFTHCKGYSTIPKIAKALGRTEMSVARRIAVVMNKRDGFDNLNDRLACIMHSLDLSASGGSFSNIKGSR